MVKLKDADFGKMINNSDLIDKLERQSFVAKAISTLMINKECLVAKWILENPDKSIEQCVFTQDSSDPYKIVFKVGTLQ